MRYFVFLMFPLISCATFQPKPVVVTKHTSVAKHVVKPRPPISREIVKELIGYVKNFSKKRSLSTTSIDKLKTFSYTLTKKIRRKEVGITLDIKPNKKGFQYICKVTVDGPSESKLVEFTASNPAEIILQIQNSLRGIR